MYLGLPTTPPGETKDQQKARWLEIMETVGSPSPADESEEKFKKRRKQIKDLIYYYRHRDDEGQREKKIKYNKVRLMSTLKMPRFASR